jgi:hypothetical protein
MNRIHGARHAWRQTRSQMSGMLHEICLDCGATRPLGSGFRTRRRVTA